MWTFHKLLLICLLTLDYAKEQTDFHLFSIFHDFSEHITGTHNYNVLIV